MKLLQGIVICIVAWFLVASTQVSAKTNRSRPGGRRRWQDDEDDPEPFGDEARLLEQLMSGYVSATRPVANASHKIIVKLGFTLTQILNMDDKNQVLSTNVWFSQEWQDEKLVWDPKDYNGLTKIRIPPKLIWRPDIVLYNGVEEYGDKMYSDCLAMVTYDGTVFWAPIANLRSTCKLDLTFFPFDDQVCSFKLGSWTYDGFQVDLVNISQEMDLNQYTVNGGWDIIGTEAKRNVVYYACCPEPFPDVTYFLFLRRRTLYYMMNIVTPCLLLSGLSLLGFWLPVCTSEKVTLGLTVLLAFYVLGLSIADRIPETSEFVPLIGLYLMVVMILTSISVAMAVFILHIHQLGDRCAHVPSWLQHLVTRYLATLVGMGYVLRHRMEETQARHLQQEEAHRRFSFDETLANRYKLLQVEGHGLYILAKDDDSTPLEKMDKEDMNDLQRMGVRENGKTLRAMKAIIVKGDNYDDDGGESGPLQQESSDRVLPITLLWYDIAQVIDRVLFWFTFLVLTVSTLSLLVILPASKPDPALARSSLMDDIA